YHLYEGWYDESPWVIPDNKKALEQFETIDVKILDNVTQEVMMKLIKLLKDNLDSEIFIEYS
ncbi:TPA: dihydroorotate dehydrogenase (quinone), partial [Listeria monocytogenes]|nr:dihydroorotate dehydrogenase (quinone) [Listeria monocytogenes]